MLSRSVPDAPRDFAQLALKWPCAEDAPEHYCEGEANQAAIGLLRAWSESLNAGDRPHGAGILITGPRQSGKSYLARFMARRINGSVVTSSTPSAPSTSPALPALLESGFRPGSYILDNAEKETASDLIRFINQCQQRQFPFILTGQGLPGSWGKADGGETTGKDLETRLLALAEAKLEHPDERLLAAALVEFLRQRGIWLKEAVSAYAAARLKRSFAAMTALGDAVEAEVLGKHAPIDKAAISRLLEAEKTIRLGA